MADGLRVVTLLPPAGHLAHSFIHPCILFDFCLVEAKHFKSPFPPLNSLHSSNVLFIPIQCSQFLLSICYPFCFLTILYVWLFPVVTILTKNKLSKLFLLTCCFLLFLLLSFDASVLKFVNSDTESLQINVFLLLL